MSDQCPECGGKMVFGIVKLLDGSHLGSVWFCEKCIYPFYGKDYFKEANEKEIEL